MPQSQIDICNNALLKAGIARIVSLADDVKQARTLSAIWDQKRDVELASHPWQFAMARAELPALSSAPLFGWACAYPLPADNLRVVEIGEFWSMYYPTEGIGFFQREGNNILTNHPSPLRIRYIRRMTVSGEWPDVFCESLSCRLAAEMTKDTTESQTDRKGAWDEYLMAISVARRANAIERPPQRPVDDTWSLAMRGVAG